MKNFFKYFIAVRERPFDFYGGLGLFFEIKRQDAPFEEKIVRTVPHKKEKGRMQVVAIKYLVSFEKKICARRRAEKKGRMQFFSK